MCYNCFPFLCRCWYKKCVFGQKKGWNALYLYPFQFNVLSLIIMNSLKVFLIESITSTQIHLLIVRFTTSISFLINLAKKILFDFLALHNCKKKFTCQV